MAKKLWAILMPFVILILGIIGFVYGEGTGLYTAILSSLKLIKGELDPLPFNMILESARWLGILYISSMFYTAIITLINHSVIFVRSYNKDAVAIHGDSIYAELLAKSLDNKTIRNDSKSAFRAPTQVIFFNDDKDTFDFYQRYSEELCDADKVHLCLNDTYRNATVKDNVYIVNISEAKAINYWQSHYIDKQMNISIIGDGQLAEKVLVWGLQMNVFDNSHNVSYSVYGDFKRFLSLHPTITEDMKTFGGDTITFDHDWTDNIEDMKQSDRIILCGKTSDNIELATILIEAGITSDIHVFIENSSIRTIFDSSNVEFIGDFSKEDIKSLILMDHIHEGGRICNTAYDVYSSNNDGSLTFDSVKNIVNSKAEKENWDNLDSFTKGSNYSAAMHDIQKYNLLLKHGMNVSGMSIHDNEQAYDQLPQVIRDNLQGIEHIRWSRYHLLNNWRPADKAIIIDGVEKRKDPVNRLHADLVPYYKLPNDEKEKDAFFYRTLSLRIDKSK